MSSIIQTRIDEKSKAEAEAIFRQMGMSLSDGNLIKIVNEVGFDNNYFLLTHSITFL